MVTYKHEKNRGQGLTSFVKVLTVTIIVIVEIMMRSTTNRTRNIFRNGLAVTRLNNKELPVLFNKGNNSGTSFSGNICDVDTSSIIENRGALLFIFK